jgi:hypothetical protein
VEKEKRNHRYCSRPLQFFQLTPAISGLAGLSLGLCNVSSCWRSADKWATVQFSYIFLSVVLDLAIYSSVDWYGFCDMNFGWLRKYSLFRASPVIIAKIAIKNVQLFILAMAFFVFSSTSSLFYSLLAFKYYFMWEKNVKEIVRKKEMDRDQK